MTNNDQILESKIINPSEESKRRSSIASDCHGSPKRGLTSFKDKQDEDESRRETLLQLQLSPEMKDHNEIRQGGFKAKFRQMQSIAQDVGDDTFNMRTIEFKAFYWIDIILLSCLIVVYWIAAIDIQYWSTVFYSDTEDKNYFVDLVVVLLRYVPMIMLNFEYMMIYFLMENLFLMSRIQSTSQM